MGDLLAWAKHIAEQPAVLTPHRCIFSSRQLDQMCKGNVVLTCWCGKNYLVRHGHVIVVDERALQAHLEAILQESFTRPHRLGGLF